MLRTILLNPLFNLLLVIYALLPGNDFGLAIIVLTIIIRILLWPLVKKQLHQQKAMQELQPEIAKVKAKAKGDRTRESQMMVELFKEKEVNPFGAIGLALVQFPILIALYFVLQHILNGDQIGSYAYGFVAKLDAVQSVIANPSSFHPSLFGIVDLSVPNVVLAVLAGLLQFVQTKQITPKNISKSSNPLGFNMVLIFPVLTVIIALNLPAALALYWATSSLVAVIQQQRVLETDLRDMLRIAGRKEASGAKR